MNTIVVVIYYKNINRIILLFLTLDPKPKTVIAYGPTFPESPTKPDAVQASLDYFIKVT